MTSPCTGPTSLLKGPDAGSAAAEPLIVHHYEHHLCKCSSPDVGRRLADLFMNQSSAMLRDLNNNKITVTSTV
jgi:hypothetical protein